MAIANATFEGPPWQHRLWGVQNLPAALPWNGFVAAYIQGSDKAVLGGSMGLLLAVLGGLGRAHVILAGPRWLLTCWLRCSVSNLYTQNHCRFFCWNSPLELLLFKIIILIQNFFSFPISLFFLWTHLSCQVPLSLTCLLVSFCGISAFALLHLLLTYMIHVLCANTCSHILNYIYSHSGGICKAVFCIL